VQQLRKCCHSEAKRRTYAVYRRQQKACSFASLNDRQCFCRQISFLFNRYAIIDCNDIIAIMASITIRKLEETTKRKLKIRAAMHGRSMEQEAREILKKALQGTSSKTGANLAAAIQRRFAPLGGVDLEPFPRGPIREPGFE
jgi:plasmid stability protein